MAPPWRDDARRCAAILLEAHCSHIVANVELPDNPVILRGLIEELLAAGHCLADSLNEQFGGGPSDLPPLLNRVWLTIELSDIEHDIAQQTKET